MRVASCAQSWPWGRGPFLGRGGRWRGSPHPLCGVRLPSRSHLGTGAREEEGLNVQKTRVSVRVSVSLLRPPGSCLSAFLLKT